MQKPTLPVSFLLTLTAGVLSVLGIVCAVMAYRVEADLLGAFPNLKLDHSAPLWMAGSVFLGFFIVSLTLAGIAQIIDNTAASAFEAEAQTEYLRQLAASAAGRTPTVDDTARMVAGQVRRDGRS